MFAARARRRRQQQVDALRAFLLYAALIAIARSIRKRSRL
jgi:hypothetical protein